MPILDDLSKLVEAEDDEEDRPIKKEPEDLEGDTEEEQDSPTMKRVADKVVKDEEEDEKSSGSAVGEILTHIDALKKIIRYVDSLTGDEAESPAFEAEVSLRKALQKMEELSDSSYKKKTEKE